MNGIHYHIAAKNRNVGLWSSPTVYQMLHNQTYAGNLVQGRHKKISYKTEKTMWLPKSQWIVVENTHEPIIDMETFETVQMMLKEHTRTGQRARYIHLQKKSSADVVEALWSRRDDSRGQTEQRYGISAAGCIKGHRSNAGTRPART